MECYFSLYKGQIPQGADLLLLTDKEQSDGATLFGRPHATKRCLRKMTLEAGLRRGWRAQEGNVREEETLGGKLDAQVPNTAWSGRR